MYINVYIKYSCMSTVLCIREVTTEYIVLYNSNSLSAALRWHFLKSTYLIWVKEITEGIAR